MKINFVFFVSTCLIPLSLFAGVDAKDNLKTEKITLGTNAPISDWPFLGVQSSEGVYPVIRLELGGAWTDFELKASTNNFINLVYYYKSSGTNPTADDNDPFVYFSDDYIADVRQWNKQNPIHSSIYNQLADVNSVVNTVYIFPSTNTVIPASLWMFATNANLVWSYVRYDGVDFEKNVGGTKQRWNLVRPERWEVLRTTP